MTQTLEKWRPGKTDIKRITSIALPAMVELLLSQLLAMVDTIMLGNTAISAIALAAIGYTDNPVNLLMGVISAFNVGITAAVAWNVGAGDYENAKATTRQGLMLNLILGIFVSVLYFLSAHGIVTFMGAKSDTIDYATAYLRIISTGLLAQTLNFTITGALRGAGLTRLPMLYNLGGNIFNVFGNYVLIFGKLGFPEMGVSGAALSTTISRYISLAAALILLFTTKNPIRIKIGESFKLRLATLKRIFKVGFTASLEQLIMQIGFIFFTKTVSGLGTTMFAAHRIGLNINGLSWVPSQAFGVASTALVGQALGAGDKPRAKGYARIIHFCSMGMSAVIAVLFILLSHQIASLYTNDAEVTKLAGDVLKLVALGMLGISTQIPISAALRGAGDVRFPLAASATGIWVFRVIVAPLFVYTLGLGLMGAWWTIVLDQTTRAAVVFIRFSGNKWLNKRV